jgi:NO-binding membrane sensor protein with MHYT domain
MLNISWDPVLIAVSYLVAFIASFVALDSAGKIPFPAEKRLCSGGLPEA